MHRTAGITALAWVCCGVPVAAHAAEEADAVPGPELPWTRRPAFTAFLHTTDEPVESAPAGDEPGSPPKERERESPWMVVPVLAINPKLGTSVGALAGYLHYFDEKSKVSIFGVQAQYTSTDSVIASAFAKANFDEDRQRLVALLVGGRIKNDYDDFLGTGRELKSEDNLHAVFARYLHQVVDEWFLGVQSIYTNYATHGETPMDGETLSTLGLTGFTAGGVGAVVYHDSRDSDTMPTCGWVLNANNIAYRDWIAGSSSFDVYRADLRIYHPHGDGNVFAVRQSNQWTVDAPPSGQATVMLRGYKFGQYLGTNMSSIEAEERLRLGDRWTATLFAGVAGLYGGGRSLSDTENLFPDAGVGIQYVLKQDAGIVVNLELAVGKNDNYGILLKLGYGF
jgi:hypothetical protein